MLRYRLGLAVMVCTLVLLATIVAQQKSTATVIIRVSDPGSAPIPGAVIRIIPAPATTSGKLQTNEHGELTVPLKAGGYTLFTSASGFKKDIRHFEVADRDMQSQTPETIPITLSIGMGGGPTIVYETNSLVLSGGIYHDPVAISPADFHALPHITLRVHNGHTNATETYSGVPLTTLLAKINAPVGKELRGEAMVCYLIASGSDGYQVALSLAEVDPEFHDGEAIVADSRDGQSLGKNGPYQLIVPGDKHPARWVHNLDGIFLKQAD